MATASDVAVQGNVGLLVNCGSGLRVLEASKMYVRLSRLRLTPRVTAMRSERGR
jgi:hypothetical protein